VKKDLIEAVAALLYNLIYDQEGRNGWTPTSSEPDPTYRAAFRLFAEALLQVLEVADPEASDEDIVRDATQRVNQGKPGFGWQHIVLGEELVSLPKEAEKYVEAVRLFLEEDPKLSVEGEFLEEEDDTTETIDEYEHRMRGEAYQNEKDLGEARREAQAGGE
jgi:hypothetical protein